MKRHFMIASHERTLRVSAAFVELPDIVPNSTYGWSDRDWTPLDESIHDDGMVGPAHQSWIEILKARDKQDAQ